ncbi:hypothetical protein AQUCO_01300854v1 [Aquilegia coerulea]|uniref:Uncharacterized protein n=1 Tax=Aquilegia coerulea TaxID=218851 RepID=A0A2G5E3Q9_AQUCA|nr:hypothetical protein AQUCO_01300854v1 [Aquilegia coerulea]
MSSSSSSSSSSSCSSSFRAKMFSKNTKLLIRSPRTCFVKFRCVFDQIAPKFVVSSSLNSILTSGNMIAAAASAATGTTSAHAAVSSAIAHVAVTAMAIASGACLSTKVDFLWPRLEEQPDSLILDGVDVTGYPIFNDEKVQKAIAFAKKAHYGQLRKTGDPYLTHCIHTGKILAALVPSSGKRAIDTVVAGILHDVIDDACGSLENIEEEFGDDVAKLVSGVSRLSGINQLLRRQRRMNLNQCGLGHEEIFSTSYALSSPKAQAVAQETLAVWCSLASKLGVWALKSELEDLCFAVLQPQTFRRMHAELASFWDPNNRASSLRRISGRANSPVPLHQDNMSLATDDDDIISMKDLLEAVLPFDLLLDRKKRTNFLSDLRSSSKDNQTIPKVVKDTRIALASLAVCEEALERELFISTSYVPGMEVTLCSRLKSLYSIYCKMKRKNIGIRQVYDARALRVVVGDKNGTLHGAAVSCCYSLLDIVHRLWTPIDGEFDDYIVNPKPSGYQSLHTAVQGPYSSPLEVQIRTQRMHEYAEYGLAAHWLYKDADGGSFQNPEASSSYQSEDETSSEDELLKYRSLRAGHPVLRVEGSHLLAAVIVRVDNGGRELLVAVSFGLGASEAVADRRSSFQIKRWEAYACLYKKVSDQWWFAPGHGDWCTCLEKYTLCKDGLYHKEDQFQRLLPTFIQVIDLTEEEAAEYWMVVSTVVEGKSVASIPSNSINFEKSIPKTSSSTIMQTGVNNKVNLLRTMLQWEEHVRTEASLAETKQDASCSECDPLGEVVIVCWPNGEIMRMRTGSTAADAARRVGLEGRLVSVNGQLSLPHTELKDGDIVEVRV